MSHLFAFHSSSHCSHFAQVRDLPASVEFCEISSLMLALELWAVCVLRKYYIWSACQFGWKFWLQRMSRSSRLSKSRLAKTATVGTPDVKNVKADTESSVTRAAFRFNIGDLVYHHKNTKMWGHIVGRGRFGERLEGSALLQQKWKKERVRDGPTASPNW